MSTRPLILGLALLGACDRRDAADLAHATDTPPIAVPGAPQPNPANPAPEAANANATSSALDPNSGAAPAPTTAAALALEPTDAPATASSSATTSFPAAPPTLASIPPDRRCGEAGEQPTELPPNLGRGRAPIGTGTLRPGDKRKIGKAALHYDPDAWIGTRKAGHRGAALSIEIDRAEVGPHDPWGAHEDLHPDQEHHTFVGPYRFDLRTGAGDPPASVAVTVSREVCPAAAVMPPAAASRSFWLSTEAIRTYTYDLAGELLQFNLEGRGDTPRLDITDLGYRHWLAPRPGGEHRFRVGPHFVTFDRVTPGPGTRHAGTWQADGDARLHVRVRIDPAADAPKPAPVAAGDPCLESSARTAVPAALTKLPAIQPPRTLDVGKELALGPLTFKYITLEIPARGHGPYREEAEQVPLLQVFGGALGGQSVSDPRMSPRIVRLGHELVRIETDGHGDRVRLRRATVTCPHEHKLPAPQAPAYVWLSALGRTVVTFPGRGTIPLSIQLYTELSGPGLSVNSENAHLSRQLRPDSAGAYTIDDYLVEIVDVVPGPDTTHDGQRWQSNGLLPIVNVQLKVTPQPGGP
ncbi:hypothetical protein OV203_39745 [Nannocystis sp. ILAH1]|uniref:hypothetical protein n=1 Tax=unclassified Nannocystis TaxID=2627009 RepID=UPI00226ED854|nr:MULTISPECIES: hypothetical protein [unclassified Nannocystis]MCY0993338.1 hypothetical protein [Nannocystis sp. ILAH1]MCY1063229.1 hypothetical protein [Nannocystis sp. RBIL2]